MPDMPMAGPGSNAGAPAAAAGASPSPGSQTTGPNPATMPVANRGTEQMALMAIGMHAAQISKLVNNLPFGSDVAREISEALNKIRRHVGSAPPPPGVERTQADAMQLAARQNAMGLARMRQQQAQQAGGGGAAPAAPSGSAPLMAA